MRINVLISGPACSGKSTLAAELADLLTRYDIKVSGDIDYPIKEDGAERNLDDISEYDHDLEVVFTTSNEETGQEGPPNDLAPAPAPV
jgi:uridine kinase